MPCHAMLTVATAEGLLVQFCCDGQQERIAHERKLKDEEERKARGDGGAARALMVSPETEPSSSEPRHNPRERLAVAGGDLQC